ncbi:MAG TPA: stage II sporulation protein M [Chryseosolibacter sp.]|nr:stage II sporulation protein M [Chryseosolibacter sp.]
MKETRFIAQNKEKWQESENLLENSERDPEKLSSLFTQVIDDLSYSRTYYPNRSVRVYLNKIARQYFSIIYSHHRSRRNAFRHFWLNELPQIVYQSRKPLIISAIVFAVAVGIGVFSSMNDPQFASAILGERYVEMTKANIEKGDPMAVYKEGHQVHMLLGITFNNLMVAFRTFVFGIFLSIGTVAILLYNGIMVGCFQYFFVERGLLAESALTIWLHGTLEISSIILAGGAGLTLGSGLLFPGTYSRLQAFQITATRALKLMLGVTPIIVLAAIIESFLTRYTDVPDAVRLILILLSGSFIVGYFIVFPWLKSRRGFDQPLQEIKLPPDVEQPVSIGRIKNNAEILKDTFVWYKKFAERLFSWIALVTLGMTIAEMTSPVPRGDTITFYFWWQSLFSTVFYAMQTPSPLFIAINAIGTSLVAYRAFVLLDSDARKTPGRSWSMPIFMQTTVMIGALYAMMFFAGIWGNLLVMITFLIVIIFCFAQVSDRTNLISGIASGWRGCAENFGQVAGLQFILLMMAVCFLIVLSAPLLYINTTILQWNFAESDTWSQRVIEFVEIFVKVFAFNLVIPMIAASGAYLHYSLTEVSTAGHLKQSIAMLENKYNKS